MVSSVRSRGKGAVFGNLMDQLAEKKALTLSQLACSLLIGQENDSSFCKDPRETYKSTFHNQLQYQICTPLINHHESSL
uniref:Uncharacterized protein n=1 Tax=Hordeum vulgare subsp. vulgare TaxID=112509 RepID=A0A8I6Y5Q6_HORVV